MPIKTSQEKSPPSPPQLEEDTTQLENLTMQNQTLTELINLREDSYFRMKLLNVLERIAEGLGNLEEDDGE